MTRQPSISKTGIGGGGVEIILLGKLNASTREPRDAREEKIATVLLDRGLIDVTSHFMLRRRYRGAGSWMWKLRQEGLQVTGRGNYILSSDRNIFLNTGVREARIFTEYWMVLAVLQGNGDLRNRRYVVSSTQWPLEALSVRPQIEGGAAFKKIPKSARAACISKETCQLANWKAELQRAGRASTREVRNARSDF